MSSLFIQQLLLSVVVAGIWISAATLVSEKVGSKLGGMISNLPSTILVSLLFVGLTQTPEFATEATITVPLGMTLSTLFLFSYVALVPRGTGIALAGGLLVWLILALFSSFFQETSRITWTIIYFCVAISTYYLAEKKLKIPSLGKTGKKYSLVQVLFRALFAGSVVGTAVFVAQTGSAFWTGLFSSFPAVMLSSMVILTLSAGPGFARALGKIMLLASTNIVIYAYFAGLFFPVMGLTWGTIFSFLIATFWVWLLRPLFNRGL